MWHRQTEALLAWKDPEMPFDRAHAHNAGPLCRSCAGCHTQTEALRLIYAAHHWKSPGPGLTDPGRPMSPKEAS